MLIQNDSSRDNKVTKENDTKWNYSKTEARKMQEKFSTATE